MELTAQGQCLNIKTCTDWAWAKLGVVNCSHLEIDPSCLLHAMAVCLLRFVVEISLQSLFDDLLYIQVGYSGL